MANIYIEKEDHYIIKTVKFFEILIDKNDYEEVKVYNWFIQNGYAYTEIDSKKVMISKILLKPKHIRREIYYLNGNTLDNRRSNISLSKNVFIKNEDNTCSILIKDKNLAIGMNNKKLIL